MNWISGHAWVAPPNPLTGAATSLQPVLERLNSALLRSPALRRVTLWYWATPLPMPAPEKMLGAVEQAALLVVIAAALEKHSAAASVLLPSTSTPVVMPLVCVSVALKLAKVPDEIRVEMTPSRSSPTSHFFMAPVLLAPAPPGVFAGPPAIWMSLIWLIAPLFPENEFMNEG